MLSQQKNSQNSDLHTISNLEVHLYYTSHIKIVWKNQPSILIDSWDIVRASGKSTEFKRKLQTGINLDKNLDLASFLKFGYLDLDEFGTTDFILLTNCKHCILPRRSRPADLDLHFFILTRGSWTKHSQRTCFTAFSEASSLTVFSLRGSTRRR